MGCIYDSEVIIMLAITGDTHGAEIRFTNPDESYNRLLGVEDYLIVTGDFGYISNGGYSENQFLKFMAEDLPYTILFIDGNHENFDLLDKYPITDWNGGKVQVIRNNRLDTPKIIHLMRGQVYEIESKKIFTFGGGYSFDRKNRTKGFNWFSQEMPTDLEKEEGIRNLESNDWKVDYIITHAAPEETMQRYETDYIKEQSLNSYLEFIRVKTDYKRWYMGHLHFDKDDWRNQTILWKTVRNMEDNSEM